MACEVCVSAYGPDYEGYLCNEHTPAVRAFAKRLAQVVNGNDRPDFVAPFLEDADAVLGGDEREPSLRDLGWQGGTRWFVIDDALWRTPDASAEGFNPIEEVIPASVVTLLASPSSEEPGGE